MIKTIASAVKQAVFSKSFLVSWIGVVAIIAVSSIQQILEAFRADELLMIGFTIPLLQTHLFQMV